MESYDAEKDDARSRDDRATRRALAYLCRSVPGFRRRSFADRVEFLQGLGLSAAAAEEVAALFERLTEGTHGAFGGVLNPEWCPIPWRPCVRAPVFHGYQDIEPLQVEPPLAAESALESTTPVLIPTAMRVFYPTLEGSPENAPLLYDCGNYPLVVFLHGQCNNAAREHYRHWYYLPQQVARCGYVVVVPKLDATNPFHDQHLQLAERVVTWMREHWQHRYMLAPPPATGIVGHSFGAILGGRLASRIPASAFVSLSGEWIETVGSQLPPPHPLDALNVPALFTWGTGEDADANLEGSGLLERVRRSKHTVVFMDGNHFDYLPPDIQTRCGPNRAGQCDLVKNLAADFTALFLTRYMPPPTASVSIAPSLEILNPGQLTQQQQFYAGLHLVGLGLIGGSSECSVTHNWFIEGGETGGMTLP